MCKHFLQRVSRVFCCVKRSRDRAKPSKSAFFAQTTTFALGCSTPNSELFLVIECVFETLHAYVASIANRARSFRRTTTFGEEDLWIDVVATRFVLPFDGLKKLGCDALHVPRPSSPWFGPREEPAVGSPPESQCCNSKLVIRFGAIPLTCYFSCAPANSSALSAISAMSNGGASHSAAPA